MARCRLFNGSIAFPAKLTIHSILADRNNGVVRFKRGLPINSPPFPTCQDQSKCLELEEYRDPLTEQLVNRDTSVTASQSIECRNKRPRGVLHSGLNPKTEPVFNSWPMIQITLIAQQMRHGHTHKCIITHTSCSTIPSCSIAAGMVMVGNVERRNGSDDLVHSAYVSNLFLLMMVIPHDVIHPDRDVVAPIGKTHNLMGGRLDIGYMMGMVVQGCRFGIGDDRKCEVRLRDGEASWIGIAVGLLYGAMLS